MILVACITLALGLRLASGLAFAGLSKVRLRGEAPLLAFLVIQLALPLLRLEGLPARVALYAWMATFPVMAGIAWANRRTPGLLVLGVGLMLNATVIALNSGMPVSADAVAAISHSSGPLVLPAGDFAHIALGPSTRLPFLGDIIPLPGPGGSSSVASPGDCLLFVGLIGAIARSTR
jgi:hypothetical protein